MPVRNNYLALIFINSIKLYVDTYPWDAVLLPIHEKWEILMSIT